MSTATLAPILAATHANTPELAATVTRLYRPSFTAKGIPVLLTATPLTHRYRRVAETLLATKITWPDGDSTASLASVLDYLGESAWLTMGEAIRNTRIGEADGPRMVSYVTALVQIMLDELEDGTFDADNYTEPDGDDNEQ